MKNKFLCEYITAMVLLIVGSIACNGDHHSGGSSNVVELSMDDTILGLGQGSVVFVDFSFPANEVFSDGTNVGVTVHLPPTLSYRPGTAELARPINDDSVHSAITVCSGGDSYLSFDLGSGDLLDATNPDGDADAELKFTVDAIELGSGEFIDASALNHGVPFSCESGMDVQQRLVVDVVL